MVIKCGCKKDKSAYACEHCMYKLCNECAEDVFVCNYCRYQYCEKCANDECDYCEHMGCEQISCPKCSTMYYELDQCLCETDLIDKIDDGDMLYCTDCKVFIYSEEHILPTDAKIHRNHIIEKDVQKLKKICIKKYPELKKSYYL